jgi:hypothetical protein
LGTIVKQARLKTRVLCVLKAEGEGDEDAREIRNAFWVKHHFYPRKQAQVEDVQASGGSTRLSDPNTGWVFENGWCTAWRAEFPHATHLAVLIGRRREHLAVQVNGYGNQMISIMLETRTR